MKTERKTGIGIVGTGMRGIDSFGQWLHQHRQDRNVTIAGLCDHNPTRLEAARKMLDPNIPAFTSYDEFLNLPGLDGVIVATPCHAHADLVIQALRSGKHVLCEKAMAITAGDCLKMVAAEKESGKRLMMGLCLRYADFMKALIPIIRRGDIGRVITVNAVDTLEGSSHFGRWHRKKEFSGGILLQKGTHTLDLINWITDEKPVAVSGFGGRDVFVARAECKDRRCLTCPEKDICPEYRNIEAEFPNAFYKNAEGVDGYIWDRCVFDPEVDIMDNASVVVDYENGKRGSYTISMFFERDGIERCFTIIGTQGKIEVSRRREEITVYKRRSKDTIHYKLEGHGEGFDSEMDDFLNIIATGSKALADSNAGLWCTLAGLAAERAIEEKRVVYLKELSGQAQP